MRLERRQLTLVLSVLGLFLAVFGYAKTVVANSTSLADVQAAVNAASSGDTVSIPAGSSTWSSYVSDKGKVIYFVGAGIGSTVITASSMGSELFYIGGGTFVGYISFVNGYIYNEFGQDWRVHHCSFDNGETWNLGVFTNSQTVPAVHTRGLVDHCTFHNSRVVINGNAWLLTDPAPGNANENMLWNQNFQFGGPEFLFVEDCSFSGDQMIDCIDSRAGGRYVFRYNTYTDTKIGQNGYMCEVHSLKSVGLRGARAWEIYNNTIISTAGMWGGVGYIRAGTGVVYNNTVVGATQWGAIINNERDTLNAGGDCGLCDGTSGWDQNTAGQAGYLCRDQIGAGKDAVQWSDGNAFTQTTDPAYFWNNTPSTVVVNLPSSPAHIVEGRDYFNRGIPRPGYTPYTYPHPLTQLGGVQAPAAPTGLRIKS